MDNQTLVIVVFAIGLIIIAALAMTHKKTKHVHVVHQAAPMNSMDVMLHQQAMATNYDNMATQAQVSATRASRDATAKMAFEASKGAAALAANKTSLQTQLGGGGGGGGGGDDEFRRELSLFRQR